jgi:hypothetical protein
MGNDGILSLAALNVSVKAAETRLESHARDISEVKDGVAENTKNIS